MFLLLPKFTLPIFWNPVLLLQLISYLHFIKVFGRRQKRNCVQCKTVVRFLFFYIWLSSFPNTIYLSFFLKSFYLYAFRAIFGVILSFRSFSVWSKTAFHCLWEVWDSLLSRMCLKVDLSKLKFPSGHYNSKLSKSSPIFQKGTRFWSIGGIHIESSFSQRDGEKVLDQVEPIFAFRFPERS